MEVLPHRETGGTRALCALFESKATLEQSFNSSPQLNCVSAAGCGTERDCPLQDLRGHNALLKDQAVQVHEYGFNKLVIHSANLVLNSETQKH